MLINLEPSMYRQLVDEGHDHRRGHRLRRQRRFLSRSDTYELDVWDVELAAILALTIMLFARERVERVVGVSFESVLRSNYRPTPTLCRSACRRCEVIHQRRP